MANPELISATGRERTRFGKTPLYREGLYDPGNGVYAWMVPNGSWGESNAGLVVGDGVSLFIDTLWDLNITGDMLQAMEPFTKDAPIKFLANTDLRAQTIDSLPRGRGAPQPTWAGPSRTSYGTYRDRRPSIPVSSSAPEHVRVRKAAAAGWRWESSLK